MKLQLITALMLISGFVKAQNQEKDSIKTHTLNNVTLSVGGSKYKSDSSSTVSKLPLKDIENPQVYNVIPKSVLKDQVVTNLNNALQNATGVTRLWESTGRGGDGGEYYTMRGFALQPTMINGMAGISNGGLDPANVETIEVIKGPSGTLFGGNLIAYGGFINIITKRPYSKFGGEVNYVTGSNQLNRLTTDINIPLSKQLFIRINSAMHSENSFQNAGFYKSVFFAPSLKFIANDKLTFLINTEYKSSESANAPMIFLSRYSPLSFNNLTLFENNYKNSFTSNSLSIKNPTYGAQSQALYKISKSWTSQTVLSASNTKSNGYYHYLWDAANGSQFTRFISKRSGETNATDIQQNFIGDFKIGKVRNRMVVGVDYLNKQIQNNSTGWMAHGIVSLATGVDSGILTPQAVDNTLLNSTEGNSNAVTQVLSAYISDVVNLSPSLSAMLSLRVDNFKGKPNYWTTDEIKNQVTLSPKFGLVYQPIKDKLSVFGNYMNGFMNIDPAMVADINGNNPTVKIFDPEHANQLEFGTKANLLKNKLALTASYYDITVANKVMTDPTNPNNSVQGGEVKSQGFELSVIGSLAEGLNIITGFSHNISKVSKDAPETGYLNLRPEEAGPQTLINLWVNYKFNSGAFKNWGIGFGGNSASEHKTLNRANTGTFTLPAYNVFNTVISYTGDNFNINFKVDNLTDQKYFTGWSTVTPQKPRTVALALGFKF